jgi:hypothetical protein
VAEEFETVRQLLIAAFATALVILSADQALAQSFTRSEPLTTTPPAVLAEAAAVRDRRFEAQFRGVPVSREPQHAPGSRPKALVGLYASLAVVQLVDVVSTRSAVNHGAVELNPTMRGSLGQQLGIKAAMTVGTIALTERLWKKNKVAAIVTAVAVNSALALVSANNLRNAR